MDPAITSVHTPEVSGAQTSRHVPVVLPPGAPPGACTASRTQLGGSSSGGRRRADVIQLWDQSAWVSGQIVSTNIKDFWILSPCANLVTANTAEESRPTAGTWNGFCYTKPRVVIVFAITDLARILHSQERAVQWPCLGQPGVRQRKGSPSRHPDRGVAGALVFSRPVCAVEKWEMRLSKNYIGKILNILLAPTWGISAGP